MAHARNGTKRKRTRRDTEARRRGRHTGDRHGAAQNATTPAEDAIPTPAEIAAAREKWAVDGFDDVDRTLLSLLASKPGITDGELAAVVGKARETVNRRKNRPIFQAALEELRLEPLVVFQRNQIKAARKLGQLIDAKDEQVAVRASLAHLSPLLRSGATGGGGGAEAFANFLEEAYSLRERRRTETTSDDKPITTAPA
jgi:hypothetical protein